MNCLTQVFLLVVVVVAVYGQAGNGGQKDESRLYELGLDLLRYQLRDDRKDLHMGEKESKTEISTHGSIKNQGDQQDELSTNLSTPYKEKNNGRRFNFQEPENVAQPRESKSDSKRNVKEKYIKQNNDHYINGKVDSTIRYSNKNDDIDARTSGKGPVQHSLHILSNKEAIHGDSITQFEDSRYPHLIIPSYRRKFFTPDGEKYLKRICQLGRNECVTVPRERVDIFRQRPNTNRSKEQDSYPQNYVVINGFQNNKNHGSRREHPSENGERILLHQLNENGQLTFKRLRRNVGDVELFRNGYQNENTERSNYRRQSEFEEFQPQRPSSDIIKYLSNPKRRQQRDRDQLIQDLLSSFPKETESDSESTSKLFHVPRNFQKPYQSASHDSFDYTKYLESGEEKQRRGEFSLEKRRRENYGIEEEVKLNPTRLQDSSEKDFSELRKRMLGSGHLENKQWQHLVALEARVFLKEKGDGT